jgi:TRAP-type C4-dicarboxylate transport system substrate-binding protein
MIKILFLMMLFLSFTTVAGVQIKLAVLVPEGTTWGISLKKFAKEVESVTNNEVALKIYYGGVAGDEPDVLRKIRISQLHGGIFTGKTLGDIYGDVRVMELPFTFYGDQARASKTLNRLAPELSRGLESKGFINLGFYEIGQVYVVSSKKIQNLNELKGVKVWSWEGDPLVSAMLESLQLVTVPLALPDVLSSLSTGIINAAYAPPLGILALQWHTKVKYLVDFPTAYSIGALLVSKNTWSKIKPDHQKKVLLLAEKFVKEANSKSLIESEQAKDILKKSGVEFIQFPQEDYKKAASFRVKVIEKLKDKYISSKIIQSLDK